VLKRIRYKKKNKLSKEELRAKSDLNKSKLHPMCMPLLAGEVSASKENSFISNSADIIMNKPHVLTEKWIASLNKWTEERLKSMIIPDPEYSIGDRISFFGLTVLSIKPPNPGHAYPATAFVCVNEIGRKHYFKSSSVKLSKIEVGHIIDFVGTVKGIGEGISFLNRVSLKEIKLKI